MLKMRDFFCQDCGREFEKLARGTQNIECPLCGSHKTYFQHSPQAIKASGLGVYDSRMRTK